MSGNLIEQTHYSQGYRRGRFWGAFGAICLCIVGALVGIALAAHVYGQAYVDPNTDYDVTWPAATTGSPPDTYQLQRDDGGGYVDFASVPGSETATGPVRVAAGESVRFRVRGCLEVLGVDDPQCGPWSDDGEQYSVGEAPGQPGPCGLVARKTAGGQ